MSLDVAALLELQPDEETLTLPAEQLAAIAPGLCVLGPDGEVWGVDGERVAVALWSLARSLHADLVLERRRSDQLDRRTRWLYKAVTGQDLPPATEET